MLAFRNISKHYGSTKALRPVDLEIPAGRTTVLIGPSGCGKSTLLRIVVRLIRPDTGTVEMNGEAITERTILAVRRRMGYVIQAGGAFPHITARANITLMARHLRWTDGRIRERLAALTELTHFPESALDRYPGELSGGQVQRVSLMRALMLDPDLLLLDEPLGALDPMIRRDLQEELRAIFLELKKTVLMVTHDLDEAAYFADRIVLMREGAVIQEGTLDDLKQRPADPFVTAFIEAQRSRLDGMEGGGT
jgi:osmoprotectant transport system ATP-binding protein